MTEHFAQSNDSTEPVPLKNILGQLVDADFSALSEAEQERKATATKLDAERHAQEAQEDWRELQQVSWAEVDPNVVHSTGELVVETQAELKSLDPGPQA